MLRCCPAASRPTCWRVPPWPPASTACSTPTAAASRSLVASVHRGEVAELCPQERRPPFRAVPPADGHAARDGEIAEAPLGLDVPAARDVLVVGAVLAVPALAADSPYRAVKADANANLGRSGPTSQLATMTSSLSARQLTPYCGSTLGGAKALRVGETGFEPGSPGPSRRDPGAPGGIRLARAVRVVLSRRRLRSD
jgi:hypothetical protein